MGDSRRYNKQHVEQIIPFLRTVGYQRKPTTLAVADHSLTTSAWAWVLAVLNTLSMCAISVKSLEPAGTDVLKCLQSSQTDFWIEKRSSSVLRTYFILFYGTTTRIIRRHTPHTYFSGSDWLLTSLSFEIIKITIVHPKTLLVFSYIEFFRAYG